MTIPAQLVLRLCVPIADLPREQCAVPDRCQDANCAVCRQLVHYDPKASIPALGSELIVCTPCLETALDELEKR